MNIDLRNKLLNVMAESNGPKALDVFNMVVYFAHGDIPMGIFSKVIQNRYELKDAIQTLQRHWLVQYSGESSFTISETIQSQQRSELFEIRVEEMILKKSISLLRTTRLSYYPHLVSVYGFSRRYPNLIRSLYDIPGNIVSGMIKDGKVAEAVEFGMECRAFLRAHLGEREWTVLHLRCNLGLGLFESGKTEEAITIITNAYKQTCSNFENDKDKIRQVMASLATVTIGGNHIWKQQNEKLLRQAVCNYKRPSDCISNMDLKRWLHYALMISSFGLKAEAIAILHDVIESRKKIFGWKDDVIADVIQTEATILASDSKCLEAMELLQIVLKERKEKFGDFNPMTLEVMIEIGKLLIKQFKLEESLKLFKEVENKLDILVADTHDRMVLTVRTEMVKIYSLKRDFERSYDVSLGVYDTLVTAFGKVHPWCFSFRRDMGDILLELHRKDDAIRVFEELLETYENSPAHEQDLIVLRSRVQSIKDERFEAEVGSLHYLAKEGDLNGVLAKIKSGTDIEKRDLTGMTPLFYASAFGQMQVARTLLRKGACSTSRNNCQTLPSDVAEDAAMRDLLNNARSVFIGVRSGDIDQVVYDTSKEPCVASARDDQGRTPLGIAVEKNLTDIAIVLLEQGADPNAPHSTTPGTHLHLAASVATAEMVRILLRKVGTRQTVSALTAKDHEGQTPLHLAARRGQLEMVRTLLAKGAVFDAATRNGVTPLHLAKDTPCEPLLRLIQNLFVETRSGRVAAVSSRLEGLEEEDVPPVLGARNDKQWNLMHLAIRRNRLELVKKFLNLQKQHQENNRGCAPL